MNLLNKDLGLEYCGGIEEIYHNLLRTFYSEKKDFLNRLVVADIEEKGRMVHSIKGLSYSVGIKKLYELSSLQYEEFKKGNIKINNEYKEIFSEAIEEIRIYIEKL